MTMVMMSDGVEEIAFKAKGQQDFDDCQFERCWGDKEEGRGVEGCFNETVGLG
jgi:hypothetical protein